MCHPYTNWKIWFILLEQTISAQKHNSHRGIQKVFNLILFIYNAFMRDSSFTSKRTQPTSLKATSSLHITPADMLGLESHVFFPTHKFDYLFWKSCKCDLFDQMWFVCSNGDVLWPRWDTVTNVMVSINATFPSQILWNLRVCSVYACTVCWLMGWRETILN